MKIVRVVNQSRPGVLQGVLCENCGVADNIFTRVRGLLGRKTLAQGEGLLIIPCPSIHMFGMKIALDVIFLSRENIVTDFVENIAPGKYYVAQNHFGKAHAALEVAPGVIAQTKVQRGDKIEIVPHQ